MGFLTNISPWPGFLAQTPAGQGQCLPKLLAFCTKMYQGLPALSTKMYQGLPALITNM